jgi:hypothetical protein
MSNISQLKVILAVVFVLIIVGVGYAGWISFDNRNKLENLNNNPKRSIATNNSEVDTSDWKTFRYDDNGLEIHYPSFYYAHLSTDNSAWMGWRYPILSIRLSEVPLGGVSKGTVNPNISIQIFEKMAVADILSFLGTKYGDVTQKEVVIGGHNAVLLEFIQETLPNEPVIHLGILIIKGPVFLYVIHSDDFYALSTQSVLSEILSHSKFSQ